MTRTIITQTLVEASNEGYRLGFEEGYAAAELTIKTIAEALREQEGQDIGFDAVHALGLCREKAWEMMGSPDFKVERVVVSAPSSETSQ